MGSRSSIVHKTHLPLTPDPQQETMADGDVSACFDAGNSFNTKLKDALSGLVKANNDRKSEIDALRGDHDQLKKDHDALEVTTTRENDLRKNEIKSLEEKQTKDNTARQMDIAKLDGKLDTGIFTCPCGGPYMFQFHIAPHDNKKALLSIRKNGEEVASIFNQNHKDNHKNSMAGQNIIIDVKRGDEIVVYAYTGTWLADFPMNHYTHWVGILLKPDENEYNMVRKSVEEGVDPTAPVPCQPDNGYE